jgi:predicted SnoaL-like aldol condensation-catalyzing enzyme
MQPCQDVTESNKQVALRFLSEAQAGRARKSIPELVTPRAKHHNAYFPAGMEALAKAMDEAAAKESRHSLDIQRVVAEGDFVVVHSHFRPDPSHPGYAVVHIFRFEGGRIAELWDLGQPVPAESPNPDGMF